MKMAAALNCKKMNNEFDTDRETKLFMQVHAITDIM